MDKFWQDNTHSPARIATQSVAGGSQLTAHSSQLTAHSSQLTIKRNDFLQKIKRFGIRLAFIFLLTVFLNTVTPAYSAPPSYNMGTTSNWNLRIDGAVAGQSGFGIGQEGGTVEGDLNNNGIPDLVISSIFADNNSRADSGSVYVIFDPILQVTGTGNTLDLATSTNWNIRYDGSAIDERLGTDYVEIADVDNDGKKDIIIGAKRADKNSRTDSGSVYVIYNSLIDDYSGTGNTVDLNTSANYNLRYDGAIASILMSDEGIDASDINANGKTDLIFADSVADFNSRSNSGSAYVILDSLIDDYSGTGNNIDLNTSSNYNIRYDGAVISDNLAGTGVYSADIDNDSHNDLLLSTQNTDFGGSGSGSVYIVNADNIATISGTGNNVDVATTTNWNIRIDGSLAGTSFSASNKKNVHFGDIDNDGFGDLIVGASFDDINFSTSGSIYIFRNALLSSLSGTGNVVSASSSNFGIRIVGGGSSRFVSDTGLDLFDFNGDGRDDIGTYYEFTNSSAYFIYSSLLDSYSGSGNTINLSDAANYSLIYFSSGFSNFIVQPLTGSDINNDGKTDPILTCQACDFNSRTNSGSVYIVYNFPHTITLNSFAARPSETFTVTGTVSASNSTTHISGVQYAADSNSPTGAWSNCTASDGGFDGYTENFTCSIFPISATNHTLYFRAYDANTSYTAQSNYASSTFNLTGGPAPINVSSSAPGSENPPLPSGTGGTLSSGGGVGVIVPNGAMTFAASFSAVPTSLSSLASSLNSCAKVPANMAKIGDINSLWFTDVYNGAHILSIVQNKPSIVSLHYNVFQLLTAGRTISPKTLKLAHCTDGGYWKVLPSSVVDPVNNTVSAITKVGGYYMIVSVRGRLVSRLGSVQGVSNIKPNIVKTKVVTPKTVVLPKKPVTDNTAKEGIIQRGVGIIRRLIH